jgi:drug/metabolite transporter (DMT)-like permease
VPPIAGALVVVSALLHAAWNAIVKAGEDPLVAAWATVAGGAIVGLPLLVAAGLPSPASGLLVVSSGCLHAFYYIALTRAYDYGDLSLVYPIARGVAPPLATVGAVLVFHETLPSVAYGGIGLIALGVLLLGALGRHVASSRLVITWSFVTAICIATYTLVDRQGIRLTSPLGYISALFWINAALLSLYVRWRRRVWPWRLVDPTQVGTLGLSGALSMGAYLLVLLALAISRVGYVAALRETSVLIAAWLGWRVLGDLQGVPRLVSSSVVALGLALLVAFR